MQSVVNFADRRAVSLRQLMLQSILHVALLRLAAVLVPVTAVTEVAIVVFSSNNSCLGRQHDNPPTAATTGLTEF